MPVRALGRVCFLQKQANDPDMTSLTGLPAIITAARAGALDHAQTLFEEGGFDRRSDDPAALAVKGRLLKDHAAQLPLTERPAAYAAAAAAYAAADALAPQPYTRINLATLTMLAGDHDESRRIAASIVGWIGSDETIRETPYYRAATLAEALLILGEVAASQATFAQAIARAPLAYEDHAATLRQLGLLARHEGLGDRWLEQFRPPRSLHYAGHLGVASIANPELVAQIDALLVDDKIGFAFGALAAGADLTIAERVLAHGGELHVVLPLGEAAFVAQSVQPYGADWVRRFAACRDAATSWTECAADTGAYEPLASHLAADVAMGAAVGQSRRLASEALQLVVIDDGPGQYGTGLQTARDARRWQVAGRATRILLSRRATNVAASGQRAEPEGRADRRLAAMLQIDFRGLATLDEAHFAQAVDGLLQPWRAALARAAPPPSIVLPCGNSRIVAFENPGAAFAFARLLLGIPTGEFPVRIAGHYGLAHWLTDPDALVGRSVGQLGAIAAASYPGILTVSETFASALLLDTGSEVYAEPLGEVGELRLLAIRCSPEGRSEA